MMMVKFIVAAGQIAVGLVVGNAASDALNKVVKHTAKKVAELKKG